MTALHNSPIYEVVELFPRQGEWTEETYFPLTERNRIVELSNGKLVVPPMPTTEHQDVVGNLYIALRVYVQTHKLGKVSIAPLPVRLWPGKVCEPDVMVMLKEHMDRVQQQCWGPPDLVVEVLSPGTQQTDRHEKLAEYAAAGVQEYWIVEPETQTVQMYVLEDEAYTISSTYSSGMTLESCLLASFTMALTDLFAET